MIIYNHRKGKENPKHQKGLDNEELHQLHRHRQERQGSGNHQHARCQLPRPLQQGGSARMDDRSGRAERGLYRSDGAPRSPVRLRGREKSRPKFFLKKGLTSCLSRVIIRMVEEAQKFVRTYTYKFD